MADQRILTVLQARMGSSRLPGKVLFPLGDSTVLGQMCRRVAMARLSGRIIVATTTAATDDPIVKECEKLGVECFRGHPTDLLDRHYQALLAYPAEAVVKIPTDCPLIDPEVIDQVLSHYIVHASEVDYVSNLHPQSYPDGNDVEVMTAEALSTAWREATKDWEREHTTPYLWDHPERFRIANVVWPKGVDLSHDFRWTLDYSEDYQVIATIFDALHKRNPAFGVENILGLLLARPEVRKLNEKHLGYIWYQKHQGELRTV